MALCEKLDAINPYNLHVVFISTQEADKETSLDLISRLGNYGDLSVYKHYFKGKEYLESMRGIVYDQDPTEIYVFVSDIEPIDYQKLQDVITI